MPDVFEKRRDGTEKTSKTMSMKHFFSMPHLQSKSENSLLAAQDILKSAVVEIENEHRNITHIKIGVAIIKIYTEQI